MTPLDVFNVLVRVWCLSIVGFCLLMARAAWQERRRNRADVRQARARGYALWLEDTAPADWAAVQRAVNHIHDANDSTLAEHFAEWDAQLTDGSAA